MVTLVQINYALSTEMAYGLCGLFFGFFLLNENNISPKYILIGSIVMHCLISSILIALNFRLNLQEAGKKQSRYIRKAYF